MSYLSCLIFVEAAIWHIKRIYLYFCRDNYKQILFYEPIKDISFTGFVLCSVVGFGTKL